MENKKEIVALLLPVLQATRNLSDLIDLTFDEKNRTRNSNIFKRIQKTRERRDGLRDINDPRHHRADRIGGTP